MTWLMENPGSILTLGKVSAVVHFHNDQSFLEFHQSKIL